MSTVASASTSARTGFPHHWPASTLESASPRPHTMPQSIELIVPKLGESITEAVIARWPKPVGEPTSMDEPVAELETDKVTVTLPAPAAGVLAAQRHPAGSTVQVGDSIGTIAAGT